MRKKASYPKPKFNDPNDRRLVSLIKRTIKPEHDALNIVGIPFDGAVLGRKGARFGPSAIREAMVYFSNYNQELDVSLLDARIFDLGDLKVHQTDVKKAHVQIEKEVHDLLLNDSLLAILGGDNSISLPSIRAYSRRFGNVGLIVLDSHYDIRGEIDGKPTSGSSYGLAMKQLRGKLEPKNVVEIGVHGFLNSYDYFKQAKSLGITTFTASYARKNGVMDVARASYEIASKDTDAVYVSLDLDCVDICDAPGVSAPSFGGLNSSEVFEVMNFLSSREKVHCIDIVELSPILDNSGKTALLAATALVYSIAGFKSRIQLGNR